MGKRKTNPHPVLTPRHMGGVVVTRIPSFTDEKTRANVQALARQIAYDQSDHTQDWKPKYKRPKTIW